MSVIDVAALVAHRDTGPLDVFADAQVPWGIVHVARSERELPQPEHDAMAILTQPGPVNAWQNEALLRRVRDAGYCALAMPWESELSEATRKVAARIGLSVLSCAQPTALAKACWELLDSRNELAIAYVQKVARSIEYEAADLADLLQFLATSVGHSVVLLDAAGVLHQAGESVPVEVLDSVDFESTWIHRVSAQPWHGVSVRVHTRVRAGLRLLFAGQGLADAQTRALSIAVEIAMPAVAARLLVDEVESLSDASRSSAVLGELLDRRGIPDRGLEAGLVERGWRSAGWHLGVRVVARAKVDDAVLAQTVSTALAALDVETHTVRYGDGITAWLTFASRPRTRMVESLIHKLRGVHEHLLSLHPVATGIGTLSSDGAGLAATLGEAADAARIAVNRRTSSWFVHYDRLGLTQLLSSWVSNDTFAPSARALLEALSGSDLRTLAAYLDHESSIAATAAALGVHRNTVGPRVRRIEEQLAVDLRDPDLRLAVHLACRLVATEF